MPGFDGQPRSTVPTTDGGPLLVLVGGPTGIGKTTIIQELVSRFPDLYKRAPSLTSRPRRVDENDLEYEFVDDSVIRRLAEAGELLNLDLVYGNYYAMSARAVRDVVSRGQSAIKEVHPRNHAAILIKVPEAISVLIVPANPVTMRIRMASTPDRIARFAEDAEFYTNLDPVPFDVILRVETGDDPQQAARSLNESIQLIRETRGVFPFPRDIDAVNRIGYSQVAPEFVDERRITTSYFHKLSESFFGSAIQRWVHPSTHCLEVGVGSGWLRAALNWPQCSYTGVDLVQPMAVSFERRHPGTSVTVTTTRALPFASDSFDTVFGSLCDPFCYPTALHEIRRVLRPGGHFILSAPAREWSDGIRNSHMASLTRFPMSDGSFAEVYSFTYTRSALQSLLRRCGFDAVNVQSITPATASDAPVAPAVLQSASVLGIALSDIPVVHAGVFRKLDSNEIALAPLDISVG